MHADVTPLRRGRCQVWWASRTDYRSTLVGLLDDVELGRLGRIVRAADRERFVLGCAITRVVLSGYLALPARAVPLRRQCADCGEPHGKVAVALARQWVQLSVSHSDDRVVVAFSADAPIGVDVERIDPRSPVFELAGSVLAESEAQWLWSVPGDLRAAAFTSYWCRKEAVVKATGQGLRTSLQSLVVTPPARSARLLESPGSPDPAATFLTDLEVGGEYRAALAVLAADPVQVDRYEAGRLLARY